MTEIQPTMLIDSRERTPLDIRTYPVEVVGLPVGDYGIKGFSDWENPQFIIERKSRSDLIGSLTQGRERFLREVEKLKRFRFASIVIEAQESDVPRASSKKPLHTISQMSGAHATDPTNSKTKQDNPI